jgi:catechol 2,3-dioxygenase-like lactoylglutathione lyase family enzyme
MAGAITGIDHLLIDVADLEAARRAWSRLGFTLTPRGRHPQWGTGNYCMMFPSGYLELIGVIDADEYARNESRRARRRAGHGLSAMALATDDADAAKAELDAHGIVTDGPKDLSRQLELESGTVEPRFHLLHLPEGASPALPLFLCRHLTPELVRRPDWLLHDNGARAIASVAVPCDDPPATLAAYERLLGPGAVTMTDEMVVLRIGGASIVLVRPHDMETLFPDVLPEEGPKPAVVTLKVADLDKTAVVLAAGRVPFGRESRAISVAAEDATGVALVFTV